MGGIYEVVIKMGLGEILTLLGGIFIQAHIQEGDIIGLL
jgi:hypothetical protein